MDRRFAFWICLLLPIPAVAADAKRPMKIEDLFRFKRVSEPQISPDGKTVAYVVGEVDLAGNKSTSALWLAASDGKTPPRQLTNANKKDRHPRWSPDGTKILFESNRGGDTQLWLIDLGGGESRQLTTISTEAGNALWSRDGKKIAFVSAVYPEFSEKPFKESDELNKKKIDEIRRSPVKAKVFTKLFYRHWDSYVEDKRQHLFVMEFELARSASKGEPKDVTPGDRDAYPTSDTFETGDNFTFSPDGKYLVFTAVPEKDEAWSTNYDICRVPVTGGMTKWETLTKDNPAADSGPVFSPDGKKLAYRAQKKAGFEADRWELLVVDVDEGGTFKGKPRSLTSKLDRGVDSFVWLLNGETIFFNAEDNAGLDIWELDVKDGGSRKFLAGGSNNSLSVSRDGNRLAFTNAALTHPNNLLHDWRLLAEARKRCGRLTTNENLLSELDLPRPDSVTLKVDGDTPNANVDPQAPGLRPEEEMAGRLPRPRRPARRLGRRLELPLEPGTLGRPGLRRRLPNPRGSTGFGQKFVDEISGDWGGKCYRDLMKAADYVEKLPYVDKDRIGAAGASFGGYMMNWFAVNTGRFKCLISHCGVWNFESMYGTTDEVWFDEWEHGGPPWGGNRKSYEKYSPHRFAGNLGKFKTPMLVIQNDLDFRCPVGQGHELFTALQRQGVPSRFINFPDEGHWVLKPKNSEYWHKEVFAWLKKYVPPGGR